jgi:SIR2-like domain
MQSKIDDIQWEMIVDRFHDRRCVPFLGAGANIGRKDPLYEGLPLGGEVANLFATKLKYPKRQAAELARIALEYQIRTDRSYLLDFLRDALPDDKRSPSPLLDTLARLPLELVITTNYDRLLERAFRNADHKFETLVQPADGFDDVPNTKALFDRLEHFPETIVYKLHGSFENGAGGSPSVIITEDDYIDFLAVHEKESERIGVPRFIRSKLVPNTLLFLGYGLQDWDFRTLYRGIVSRLNKHDKRRSFAIQRKPVRYWVRYWENQGITIVDLDVYEFAEQLATRYFERYPEPATGRTV